MFSLDCLVYCKGTFGMSDFSLTSFLYVFLNSGDLLIFISQISAIFRLVYSAVT